MASDSFAFMNVVLFALLTEKTDEMTRQFPIKDSGVAMIDKIAKYALSLPVDTAVVSLNDKFSLPL